MTSSGAGVASGAGLPKVKAFRKERTRSESCILTGPKCKDKAGVFRKGMREER